MLKKRINLLLKIVKTVKKGGKMIITNATLAFLIIVLITQAQKLILIPILAGKALAAS